MDGIRTIVSPKLHTSERASYLTVSPGMESMRSGCRQNTTHNISPNRPADHQHTVWSQTSCLCRGVQTDTYQIRHVPHPPVPHPPLKPVTPAHTSSILFCPLTAMKRAQPMLVEQKEPCRTPAMPKSHSLITPSLLMSMLEGFTSEVDTHTHSSPSWAHTTTYTQGNASLSALPGLVEKQASSSPHRKGGSDCDTSTE